jgi:pantothenate kinase-related protein Tda10
MPLSVRLDKKTESLLEQTASTLKTSKAEVIKQSLSDYCARILTEKRKRPYELIKDLLGKEGSGKSDLSLRSEEILRKRFKNIHP